MYICYPDISFVCIVKNNRHYLQRDMADIACCTTRQTMSAALHYSQFLPYDTADSAC